jgi:hypothetical protein
MRSRKIVTAMLKFTLCAICAALAGQTAERRATSPTVCGQFHTGRVCRTGAGDSSGSPFSHIGETRGLAVQAGLYPNLRNDTCNPQQVAPTQNNFFTSGLTQEIVRDGKLKLRCASATNVSLQVDAKEWSFVT